MREDDVSEREPRSDTALVDAARAGDQDAYAELWKRHYRAGLNAAGAVTRTFSAEDLVQESFASIYQAIRAGKGPTQGFRPYLLTTIRNTAAQWGRAKRESADDELDSLADEASTRSSDDAFDKTITVGAFRSLPTRWQEVLWYTEVEQMKPADVAPLLGMKAAAVSQLAFRAREGLREAWIQAHLRALGDHPECEWTVGQLGAYARDNASKRDRERVRKHLDECTRCVIVAEEADQVSNRIALVLLPLTLGVAGAGGYLASLQTTSSAAVAMAVGGGPGAFVPLPEPGAAAGAAAASAHAGAAGASAVALKLVGIAAAAVLVVGGTVAGVAAYTQARTTADAAAAAAATAEQAAAAEQIAEDDAEAPPVADEPVVEPVPVPAPVIAEPVLEPAAPVAAPPAPRQPAAPAPAPGDPAPPVVPPVEPPVEPPVVPTVGPAVSYGDLIWGLGEPLIADIYLQGMAEPEMELRLLIDGIEHQRMTTGADGLWFFHEVLLLGILLAPETEIAVQYLIEGEPGPQTSYTVAELEAVVGGDPEL
ncbi:hypothetical protein ASD56_11215 [Microbacterium sp. Root166]|uniref:sigma-70 family RNA polymerase sigma factor n=1 Tax=Microbacterium sp. Root166 TaxID=1736478 RepID=UPI0007017A54|nr:sigma-70 family RNA polymerase sigma factor [Microbacterium sp. Root166]KQZ84512.1 hypothetical protein ASD56_11215 [Microbacterium sp. Root166]